MDGTGCGSLHIGKISLSTCQPISLMRSAQQPCHQISHSLRMDTTPAHILWARNPNQRISHYKNELVKVQNLYYDRRHKQCISACEQQLQRSEVCHTTTGRSFKESRNSNTMSQIHALQQAFLWFYHAVSYESIGLLAHNYSDNKLRFLDLARETYNSALKCLPLPYVSTEAGIYEQPGSSPLALEFTTLRTEKQSKATHDLSLEPTHVAEVPSSSSAGSFYSTASPSKVETTASYVEEPPSPEIYADEEEPTLYAPTEQGDTPQPEQLAPPTTPATHKARLSRVLSSPQAVQEELIPSPLFSRNPKPAHLPTPIDGADISRPLPPLPFNHNTATFKLHGTRIIQDPHYLMRKTAVRTLIARFEGVLPLPPSTPTATSHSDASNTRNLHATISHDSRRILP